jgi:recombination protein RecT
MNNKIQKSGTETIAGLIQKSESLLVQIIPKHLDAERMTRIALGALKTTPKLGECSPASVIGAVIQASILGLEVNTPLGHAYLVPYKGNCQLIPGYKGYVHLARQSGARLTGRAVFDGDEFEVQYGTQESIRHKPLGARIPNKLIATYAISADPSGMIQFKDLTLDEINARKQRSMARNSGPWVTDFVPMAIKSAVRALAPWLPLAPTLQHAAKLEEAAERRGTQFAALDVRALEGISDLGLEIPRDEEPEPEEQRQASPFTRDREPGEDDL